MRMRTTFGLLTGAALVAAMFASAPVQADVTFNVFTDPHPVGSGGTIGFAYAGDKFVGSLYHGGTEVLYSTNLTGGNVQLFAPSVNFADGGEHFISSSIGLGGFGNRDIYVADGSNILRISHDGTSSSTFLSGVNGGVRGILFDSIGTFNHDMIVTTTSGTIYRVNSAGNATVLANVGEDTEGLDVAPLGNNFGGFDGQLVVASENSGFLRAIQTDGTVTIINPNDRIGSAEELTFVPLNLGASGNPVEGFYGSNFTENVIKADIDQFTGMLGDIIVTGETTHQVNRVHWNGSSFEYSVIGSFPSQPEDGIFVTAAIITGGGGSVPEPGTTSLLLGAGLSGAAFAVRRRSRRSRR